MCRFFKFYGVKVIKQKIRQVFISILIFFRDFLGFGCPNSSSPPNKIKLTVPHNHGRNGRRGPYWAAVGVQELGKSMLVTAPNQCCNGRHGHIRPQLRTNIISSKIGLLAPLALLWLRYSWPIVATFSLCFAGGTPAPCWRSATPHRQFSMYRVNVGPDLHHLVFFWRHVLVPSPSFTFINAVMYVHVASLR